MGAWVTEHTRSSPHSQTQMQTIAARPQAQALNTQPTVSSRKKPAVPSAANSGIQPSPGSTIR